MRILLLGKAAPRLEKFLVSRGHKIQCTEDKNLRPYFESDYLISFGYRHIIGGDILDHFQNKAINLHISYLPWNRGADPNFWSFLENTPKGVTIHQIDSGLDTGEILAQREVEMSKDDTLATSFDRLMEEMVILFESFWPKIESGTLNSKRQQGSGSSHKTKDLEAFRHLLTKGWDTPVQIISDYGRANGLFKR